MHICAKPAWTNFVMQACSGLQDLYTLNAHIVARFLLLFLGLNGVAKKASRPLAARFP